MCFACTNGGFWPWGQRPTQVAPPPVKEELIYLDADTGFYPDYRTVSEVFMSTAALFFLQNLHRI
jgi:hypothetical protein